MVTTLKGCSQSRRLNKRAISSPAEHRFHTAGVAGAAPASPTILAKFWSRVDVKSVRFCWQWKSNTDDQGYGRFRHSSKDPEIKAHRFAWQAFNGPVPEGLMILHSCDNTWCCNPRHLRPGTAQDNSHDCLSRGRHVSLTGKRNGRSKLTDEQVTTIRRCDRTNTSLAAEYGVSHSLISMIRNGSRRRCNF